MVWSLGVGPHICETSPIVCYSFVPPQTGPLCAVVAECRAGRSPPLAPAAFDAILETKSFTSKNADLDKVKALYAGAFEQRIGQAEELLFNRLDWGDAEVKVLCQALHAAKALKMLWLSGNAIQAEGMAALAACLREGAAPKLKTIVLFGNPGVSDAAMQELKEAREGLTAGTSVSSSRPSSASQA